MDKKLIKLFNKNKNHGIETIIIWENELPEPEELIKIIKQYDKR